MADPYAFQAQSTDVVILIGNRDQNQNHSDSMITTSRASG